MRPDSLFRFESAVRLPAILCFTLAATLMLAPGVVYLMFGMDGGAGASIIARRAACLFLGLGVICWLAAKGWTKVDRVVSAGLVVSMGAVALLGVVEFMRGAVGPGIWPAIAVELGIAALFAPHISR